MHATSRTIFLTLSLLLAGATAAQSPNGGYLDGAIAMSLDPGRYLASLPESLLSIERKHGFWEINYCPDNTCDSIQLSTSIEEVEVKQLILGFFVYFNKYTYLSLWQKQARQNKGVQSEIQSLSNVECRRTSEKKLLECRYKKLASEGKLKFFSIRFDENKKTKTRLRLFDVFN